MNQEVNAKHRTTTLSEAESTGSVEAVEKTYRLLMSGYGAGQVRLAIVLNEIGKVHTVVEVVGTLKGKPITIVLDQRQRWVASRPDFERIGYTWLAEFDR